MRLLVTFLFTAIVFTSYGQTPFPSLVPTNPDSLKMIVNSNGAPRTVNAIDLYKNNTKRVFNVVKYGAVPNDATDDAASIQSAINACKTAGGGTVWFPLGRYLIGTALQTSINSTNPNSQLYIPLTRYGLDSGVSITLEGEIYTNMTKPININKEGYNVIIESTITGSGTAPSVLGSPTYSSSLGSRNHTFFTVKNMIIRTAPGSGMSGLNMEAMSQLNLDNVSVEINHSSINLDQPTLETYGVIFPAELNFGYLNVGTLRVNGYKYGIVPGEHLNAEHIYLSYCGYGIYSKNRQQHVASIHHLSVEHCTYGIRLDANAMMTISTYSAEHWPTSDQWYSCIYDVYVGNLSITTKLYIDHINIGQANTLGLIVDDFKSNDLSKISIRSINNHDIENDLATFSNGGTLNLVYNRRATISLASNGSINLVNPKAGDKVEIVAKQDAVGSRTLAIAGVPIPLTGTANSADNITGIYDGAAWYFSSRPTTSTGSNSYASNFISAVQAAGGSLTSGEQAALNTFESSANANGYLSLLQRLFLFVGGNIAAQKLDFLGNTALTTIGCTYTSTGLQTNGTSDYFNSNVIPATHLLQNNVSFFVKMKNNTAPSVGITGCYSGSSSELPNLSMAFNIDGSNSTFVIGSTNAILTYPNPDFSKILIGTRRSSTDQQGYVDGASVGTTNTAIGVGLPTVASYGAARNTNGGVTNFIANTWQVFGFAKGMTSAQVAAFNSDLKTLLTALGR